ncbi:MAG: restriction endonuclease [Oscillibacter sp.]|nr:restriction endonuclease [Oscillibacter sp.]
MGDTMTWKELLQDALNQLGGEAHLEEIYSYVESSSQKSLTSSWKATVRHELERASSDSQNFDGNQDLFYSAHGLGGGKWGLRSFVPTVESMDITQDDSGFPEGRAVLRNHLLRERNHQVILLAKKRYLEQHGHLACEVCGFDFEAHYGEIGQEFIEGHHTKPVSELEPGEQTRVEDISLLCSNCHSMIHRRRPWLTKEQLKSLLVSV